MTWVVEAIEGVRDEAAARAAGLPRETPLRQQLAEARCRLRPAAHKDRGHQGRRHDHRGRAHARTDGKPTDYQAARTESLGHELEDVVVDFQKLTAKDLPAINSGLKKKKLDSITVLAEGDWQKTKAESAVAAGAGMRTDEDRIREID
jgi:hypothetical protein